MKKLSDIKSFVFKPIKRSIKNNKLLESNLIFFMALIIYKLNNLFVIHCLILEYLFKINYILNRLAVYSSLPGYAYADTQTAIWQLLDYPGATDSAVIFTPNNVTFILNDANINGANYIPCKPNDYNCIFMISFSLAQTIVGTPTPLFTPPVGSPPLTSTNFAQVMILPIQLKNLIDSPFYVDCDC